MENNSTIVILVTVSGIIGGGITAIVGWLIQKQKTKYEQEQAIKKDTITEYQDLLKRQGDRIAKLEEKSEACEKREAGLGKNYVRALGRIEVLEDALQRAGIPFKAWVEPDGETKLAEQDGTTHA